MDFLIFKKYNNRNTYLVSKQSLSKRHLKP